MRYTQCLFAALLFSGQLVLNPMAIGDTLPQPISLSFDLPACIKPAIDQPPLKPPTGFVLARTDWVDWNRDGFCDVAYLYAPRDKKPAPHEAKIWRFTDGGNAAHFFVSTHEGTAWHQVQEMIHASLSMKLREDVPFHLLGTHYTITDTSHFLVDGLAWAYSPQLGVLLSSSKDTAPMFIRRWSTDQQAFVYDEGKPATMGTDILLGKLWMAENARRKEAQRDESAQVQPDASPKPKRP